MTILYIDMNDLEKIVAESHSFAEVVRKFKKFPNTHQIKKFKKLISDRKIDTNHFTINGSVPKQKVEKFCPICNKLFIPKYNNKQVTCSYSCSNTFFARKRNKPENYKSYRTICWHNHDKKCIICNEDKIVAVHHYDGNDKNNSPENLIPLCPTHHGYWHSRYRYLIRESVEKYRSLFIEKIDIKIN